MLVEAARVDDLDQIRQLLAGAGLPAIDLTPALLTHFVVVRGGDGLIAVGGIEWNDESALLRSIAVEATSRGAGIGDAIVGALEDRVRQHGASSIYLLTTTATAYFEKRGYRTLPREQAPAGIRSTAQFSGLCPSSSTFMSKTL